VISIPSAAALSELVVPLNKIVSLFPIALDEDMFVREQAILTQEDRNRTWKNDRDARALFAYAKKKADGQPILPCYVVSECSSPYGRGSGGKDWRVSPDSWSAAEEYARKTHPRKYGPSSFQVSA
jgi:hypothetical protein